MPLWPSSFTCTITSPGCPFSKVLAWHSSLWPMTRASARFAGTTVVLSDPAWSSSHLMTLQAQTQADLFIALWTMDWWRNHLKHGAIPRFAGARDGKCTLGVVWAEMGRRNQGIVAREIRGNATFGFMGFKDKNKAQQGIWKMQSSVETREKSKQSWIAGPLEASWSCSINTVTEALLLNRSLWSPFSRLYLPGPGLEHPPHPLMALRSILISFPRHWTSLLHDSMKQNLFSSLLLLPKTDIGFDKGENTYRQTAILFLFAAILR